jgi:2-succinyl-5-enolpyruvyl-6-hydroxy-3-cyclohexene-1-carboxylate synthase
MLVDDGAGWDRPLRPGRELVIADPVAFAETAAEAAHGESSADPGWRAGWIEADRAAAAALDAWFERLREPFEGAVARALPQALPADAVVVVGNSMPVRDLDAFLPPTPTPLRFIGNRGASGIDGLLSTTFGAGAGLAQPVVGIVGDLSFLHDLTALAAGVRLGLDATFVLVDNDGGGIFSFLPQARSDLVAPEVFEQHWGTPHGLDIATIATAMGLGVTTITDRAGFRSAVARPIVGPELIEVHTDRANNVLHHDAVRRAIAEGLRGRHEVEQGS